MSALSKQVIEDLVIFFEDFSEEMFINGNFIDIVMDQDRLKERSKKEFDGIYVGDLLYFAKVKEFIREPKIGDMQIINKKKYTIFDVRKDLGLYEIILKVATN